MPGRILLAALFLGIVFDAIFYGEPLGVSLPLFVGLLLVALEGLGRSKGIRAAGRNRWLLLPLLLLSGMVTVRANPFLTTLNLLAILSLLGMLAHFYTGGDLRTLSLPGYAAVLVRVGLHALSDTFSLLQARPRLTTMRKDRMVVPSLVRGLLLATPLLFIFTVLLASADLIFASTLVRIFSELLSSLWEGITRSAVIFTVAWVLAGGLAYALLREDPAGTPSLDRAATQVRRYLSIESLEAAVVLGLVDVLFLLFVWIQFAYLFAGRTGALPEGYTYAQYARYGFFELIAVSILALLVILTLEWLTPRPHRRQRLLFRLLAGLMVLLVLVMLASAFIRLRLYEQAFGYTRLRLTVHVFMVWLGLLLLWLPVSEWWGRERLVSPMAGEGLAGRFAIGAFVAALGFLLSLNALNPDAFIVRQNLARRQETGRLDALYLASLSDDAVPALTGALGTLRGAQREILCARLQGRLAALQEDPRALRWPAWHLSARRAYRALEHEGWQNACPTLARDEP